MSPSSGNNMSYMQHEARSFVKIIIECGYGLIYINNSSSTTSIFHSYQNMFSSSMLHVSTHVVSLVAARAENVCLAD